MKRHYAILTALVAAAIVLASIPSRADNSSSSGPGESWSSCTGSLCIDAPPQGPQGLDGSGGWGWNAAAKAPVTSLQVGKAAAFTVTVLQPGTVPFCGAQSLTITLTYSSADFTLNPVDSRGVTGVQTFDRGGVLVFTYTGDFLCHTDQSVAFTFTPKSAADSALVTAAVEVAGEKASETFPVDIVKPITKRGY